MGEALRTRKKNEIIDIFQRAIMENPLLAVKSLFYFRDIRGGQGERRKSRIILNLLGHNYPQIIKKNISNIPGKIYIVSDMEFDVACKSNSKTNIEIIRKKYTMSGYTMPKLVFWNVSSRNNHSPITPSGRGVFLVSGCSSSLFEHAMKNETLTAYDLMLNVLNSPGYERITI
ncbi:MAG: DUF2828 family protein [Spirochaetales bacterium]|nr:DUF2828 family protein [Spirochaetales bacterium]